MESRDQSLRTVRSSDVTLEVDLSRERRALEIEYAHQSDARAIRPPFARSDPMLHGRAPDPSGIDLEVDLPSDWRTLDLERAGHYDLRSTKGPRGN